MPLSVTMRNVFDQYEQPENRLTHALCSVLAHDRTLLRPFLRWLGVTEVPPPKTLIVTEQQVPGVLQSGQEHPEERGLPDACIFNEDGWAVLFECKVQARISSGQLRRHRQTAVRHGFKSPKLVTVSVDAPDAAERNGIASVAWRDIYAWFSRRSSSSWWATELVRYMQLFEWRMLEKDYDIRGTITVFDGLRFDEDNPYTYQEARRLVRLLGDELQARRDLRELGVDPDGARRPAITGRQGDQVWDFLPLRWARGSQQFTSYPHLTLAIHRDAAKASITIPNGVKGGFRSKVVELCQETEQTLPQVTGRFTTPGWAS